MDELTHRERVLMALSHEEPDRVPIDLGGICTSLMVDTYKNFKKFLGINTETKVESKIWQYAKIEEEVLAKLPQVDFRHVSAGARAKKRSDKLGHLINQSGDSFMDEWGVIRKKHMHYYEIVCHPLKDATIDDLENYNWPDPSGAGRTQGLRQDVEQLRQNTDYAIVGAAGGESIFEQAWYLRGYPEFLVDLKVNKEFAHALLRRITDIQKMKIRAFYDAVSANDIDVMVCGDDLGTQWGSTISPDTYREMIKFYHAELFQTIKEGQNVKLWFHSCGSIYELIGDLIELGIDILNPVQVWATNMDTKKLKKEFGNKLCFWGAIDSQRVLPFGTVDDVKREVRKRIQDLAPGGGYVLAGIHNLQPDTPPENIWAMYQEAVKFGRYPLNF